MPIIASKSLSKGRSKKKLKILLYKLLILALLIFIMLFFIDINMRPILKDISEYHGKAIASKVINDSIIKVMNDYNYNYENLVNIIKDSNSNIIGIESKIVNINKLQSEITNSVIENISNLDQKSIKVPIGSLTGLQYFHGRGPKIDLVIIPNGYVKTDIISSFESAGINQTHHKILLNLEVNISVLIPMYTARVSVPSNFTLAETVIVGNVPQYFTEVISSDQKEISDVNDYGNPTPKIN